MTPELLRQYLLGRGSAAERAAMEQRLFEDDEFEALLGEAEADLLDDWARGRLHLADATLVEQRFPKAKRHLAASLARKSRKPSRLRWWAVAAAAAIIILAAALALPRRSPAPQAIAELRLQHQATRGRNMPIYRPRAGQNIRLTVPILPGYTDWRLQIEPRPPIAGTVVNGQVTATFELPDGRFELLVFARSTSGTVPELVAVYPFELRRDVSAFSPLEK